MLSSLSCHVLVFHTFCCALLPPGSGSPPFGSGEPGPAWPMQRSQHGRYCWQKKLLVSRRGLGIALPGHIRRSGSKSTLRRDKHQIHILEKEQKRPSLDTPPQKPSCATRSSQFEAGRPAFLRRTLHHRIFKIAEAISPVLWERRCQFCSEKSTRQPFPGSLDSFSCQGEAERDMHFGKGGEISFSLPYKHPHRTPNWMAGQQRLTCPRLSAKNKNKKNTGREVSKAGLWSRRAQSEAPSRLPRSTEFILDFLSLKENGKHSKKKCMWFNGPHGSQHIAVA